MRVIYSIVHYNIQYHHNIQYHVIRMSVACVRAGGCVWGETDSGRAQQQANKRARARMRARKSEKEERGENRSTNILICA